MSGGGDGKIVPPNVLYDFDADDYQTTNEVLSGPLSDTGWVVINDGFKISNSSGKNWLESTRGSSVAYREFGKNFYGTLYFSYINNSGANREISIMLNDIPSFTGSNGYQFQVNNPSGLYTMYRYISGSYTTLLNNNNVTPYNNLYYFCITRDNNGIFKLYIKGGAYSVWTQPTQNTITDTTHSYINYLAIYFDGASIKLSDIILFDQVINPTTTPELIPNI